MLAISEHLFFDECYLFVPYELIYHHPGVIELLNPEKVKNPSSGITRLIFYGYLRSLHRWTCLEASRYIRFRNRKLDSLPHYLVVSGSLGQHDNIFMVILFGC
jgi:hypothetical protein